MLDGGGIGVRLDRARTRWAYAVLRIGFLDVVEGDYAAAEQRLADVLRLAVELSADDLHAAAINLRAELALREDRHEDAERGFRGVWTSSAAPFDRRAVAGLGLAVLAADRPADAWAYVDQVHELQPLLIEPLTSRAVQPTG